MQVSVLLVSHNGEQWLPAVLAAVANSTVKPEQLVAVDAKSTDNSLLLLAQHPQWNAYDAPGSSFASGIATGLAALAEVPDDSWVWILHDDSAPDPTALAEFKQAVVQYPQVEIFGAKLREWPSLRRILEAGVTISSIANRETNIERGEYDQGQLDFQLNKEVLAVNTAGMFVRKSVLAKIQFDPNLSELGTDIDFGWRAWQQGHQVRIVPGAVVFHAEAGRNSLRPDSADQHYHERRTLQLTRAFNSEPKWVLPRIVLMILHGLASAFGYLLVREPKLAWAEIRAIRSLGNISLISQGRKLRQPGASSPVAASLLAPWWLPIRHGLDYLRDVLSAGVALGKDLIAKVKPASGWWELRRNPILWALLVGLGASLVVHYTGWVRLNLAGIWPETVNQFAQRYYNVTGEAAPSHLFWLTGASSLTFGSPSFLYWLLNTFGLFLAAATGYWMLAKLIENSWLRVSLAGGYFLLLSTLLGVYPNNLAVVIAGILLPLQAGLIQQVLFSDAKQSWRASWRLGLISAILVAFMPYFGVVNLLFAAIAGALLWRDAAVWKSLLVWQLVSLGLNLPALPRMLRTPDWVWVDAAGLHDRIVNPGLLAPYLAKPWIGVGVLAIFGLVIWALFRPATRLAVIWCLAIATLALVVFAFGNFQSIDLPGVGASFHPWLSGLPVLFFGALILIPGLALDKILPSKSISNWQRSYLFVGGVLVMGALVAAGWALLHPQKSEPLALTPRYLLDLGKANTAEGTLLIKADGRGGLRYQKLTNGRQLLGDEELQAAVKANPELTKLAQNLVLDPDRKTAQNLAKFGIGYLYVPSPVPVDLSAKLDATTGFSRASAGNIDPAAAAWRLQATTSFDRISQPRNSFRIFWWLCQGLLLLVVLVMILPTTYRRRK